MLYFVYFQKISEMDAETVKHFRQSGRRSPKTKVICMFSRFQM